MNIADVIKTSPGEMQKMYALCCLDCSDVIFSFAKSRSQVAVSAECQGWQRNTRQEWFCPKCVERMINEANFEAGGISA